MQIQVFQAPKSMFFPWCRTASECIYLGTNFIFCLIDKHLTFGEGKKTTFLTSSLSTRGTCSPHLHHLLLSSNLIPCDHFFCLSPKSKLSSFLQELTRCQIFSLVMIIFGTTRWSFSISILFLFPLLPATLTPPPPPPQHGCVLSDFLCFQLICAYPGIWSHKITAFEVNGKSS